MKPFSVIALGIAVFLILMGIGGCGYLWSLGDATKTRARQPVDVNLSLPQLNQLKK